MHNKQRKILRDNRRHIIDHYGTVRAHTIAEKHRRAIKPLLTADELAADFNESKDFREKTEMTLMYADECKEVSPEDFEKLRELAPIPLPSGSEFIQTTANDCWARFVEE